MSGAVAVDRVPGAGHLHVAGVLLYRQPPPSDRHACDHDPAVALPLRSFLHSDVHQLQLISFGLEPEVDGVLLLGLVLVVEYDIGKPSIAFHAAHDLDLLELKIVVCIECWFVKNEGAVLGALGDGLLHSLVDVVLSEFFGRFRRGCGRCRLRRLTCLFGHDRRRAHGKGRGKYRGLYQRNTAIEPELRHWLVLPFDGAGTSADLAVASTLIACAASRLPFSLATSAAG